MGQRNLAILNKTGISMFWDSCFDSKLNFSKNLKISLVAKRVIHLFFMERMSKNIVFYRRFKLFKLIKHKGRKNVLGLKLQKRRRCLFLIKKFKRLKTLKSYFKKIKRVPAYQTRVFFIKYNNWLIVTFRLYVPRSRVFFRRRRKSKFFKKHFLSIYWRYYLLNCLKNKYIKLADNHQNQFINSF